MVGISLRVESGPGVRPDKFPVLSTSKGALDGDTSSAIPRGVSAIASRTTSALAGNLERSEWGDECLAT